jgi:hypothetical protein
MDDLITEEWLKSAGFRCHQFDRQNTKQWLLWLGDAVRDGRSFVATEDLGIELSFDHTVDGNRWSVWLRGDCSHRYSRFIHIRYITTCGELFAMVVGLTGVAWNPENHRRGCVLTPAQAQHDRDADERLDRRIMRASKWRSIEDDDSRGGALPEHMQHAIDAGLSK